MDDDEQSVASIIARAFDSAGAYTLRIPKHVFLGELISNRKVLLHGSTEVDLTALHPNHARCFSKSFGNNFGVYATSNPLIAIMFAIAHGSIKMTYDLYNDTLNPDPSKYSFDLTHYGKENFNFGNGMVYILPGNTFIQGRDENNRLISEWLSPTELNVLGKIPVMPCDYPFF